MCSGEWQVIYSGRNHQRHTTRQRIGLILFVYYWPTWWCNMYSKYIRRWHQALPGYKFPCGLSITSGWPKSLEALKEEKDIGLTIDQYLRFHRHVSKAVNKGSRMFVLVRVSFTCIDETTLLRLFTTMVLIWCPRFRHDKLEVEIIQRRVTSWYQTWEVSHVEIG